MRFAYASSYDESFDQKMFTTGAEIQKERYGTGHPATYIDATHELLQQSPDVATSCPHTGDSDGACLSYVVA